MNPLVDRSEFEIGAFSEWQWLVRTPAKALFLTVFGDWIYEHSSGISVLSPSAADTFEIATVAEEIDWAIEDVPDRAPWLYPGVLEGLREAGISREQGKIFHFVTPLFLGGLPVLSNIQRLEIPAYLSGMQKLLKQSM